MRLPFLLSGPILRRAHSKKIIIWMASSQPTQIKGELFQIEPAQPIKESTSTSPSYPTHGDFIYKKIDLMNQTKSAKLGQNLYIYLIELSPRIGDFPADTFLGYNLFFQSNGKTFDLGDLGLLSSENPESIIYDPFFYPTFILKKQPHTNYLYGSCRKFHGSGKDSLPESDLLFRDQAFDIQKRPHALFLMGDQIYADDVGGPIRPFLTQIGEAMLGNKKETLSELDSRLKLKPFTEALQQVNGRQFIIEEFAQFTSTNAQNHLMTFGEYAAMYLMNWSPELWKVLDAAGGMPSFEKVINSEQLYTAFPKNDPTFESQYRKEIKQAKKIYSEQFKDITSFKKGLSSVRRLLANVPTYMIFDDHDLTDDWNLSFQWRQNIDRSPLGKHIIANGLTAYWAFQGWGNNPDVFSPSFIKTIEHYLALLKLAGPTYTTWVDQLWQFSDWAFVAPTEPRALFLDTRTQRGYDPIPEPVQLGKTTRETPMSSELIGPKGWERTKRILHESGWRKGSPLIIISATPLYGIETIENFVIKYIYPFRSLGIPVEFSFDIEAWKDNGKGFTKFIELLDVWDPDPCFILSGDVHYAFQAESQIQFSSKGKKPRTYYQLTSSPIKNESFPGLFGYLVQFFTWWHTTRSHNEVDHIYNDQYRKLAKQQLINDPKSINWSEKIKYEPVFRRGKIMETHNNMGLLTLQSNDSAEWQNTFFM